MYKFLLCWRYLRTRYIVLVSIISVTLGVATMIVVNAVMSGFAVEMQNRLHGILSDVMLTGRNMSGFPDPQWHMDKIREVVGDSIEAMTPTAHVPGMLSYRFRDIWVTDQVEVIGIDEKSQGLVGDFTKYLQHPENRKQMSFQLREGGFSTVDPQGGADAIQRPGLAAGGWSHRRDVAKAAQFDRQFMQKESKKAGDAAATEKTQDAPDPFVGAGLTAKAGTTVKEFDPAQEQHPGAVMGIALAIHRTPDGEDQFLALPGDDITLAYPNATDSGADVKIVHGNYTIVDFYESKMSEYDSKLVFVPLKQLQDDRGMVVPGSPIRYVNAIQIKLKPGVDLDAFRDRLIRSGAFPMDRYLVQTWRDKQGPLLEAVRMEIAILNVLLFLIIAVSGFGILAIFFMIVVEKTRDIGILKSLGASQRGIMAIFLGYGLTLGAVGSGLGMIAGLLIVQYINQIADFIGWVRGQKVFDPSIYYFYKIPAIKDPWTVTWIVCGTLAIAVLASVLPALRAARLHPVEALRHE